MPQTTPFRRTQFPLAVLVTAMVLRLGSLPTAAAAPVASEALKSNQTGYTKVARRIRVVSTAYSSTVDQTDSTPCITANGYNLCAANEENVVAANFLRFGTKVRLPEYSGEKVYTVQDRMHPRFSRRLDLWMRDREAAKLFGIRTVTVEVLE